MSGIKRDAESWTDTDTDNVIISAGILQISEFRFFKVAYSDWYGVDISDKALEPIFSNYMFRNVVPHWVRRLARIVLSRSRQGVLNPKDFNIKYRKATPELQTIGYHYLITLAFVLVLFLVLTAGFEPY
jgi:hypothetical protein